MKKVTLLLLFVSVLTAKPLFADNDKPITFSQLPATAQSFVKQHFGDLKISFVKKETSWFSPSYDVIFTNGDKVEFDKSGNWTNVDCEHRRIPAGIVPAAIQQYVSTHFPDTYIEQIERSSRNRYDVELSNGVDLDFDGKFRFLRIDH